MALRRDSRTRTEMERHGKLMIFGRPTLMWDDAPTPEEYYGSQGFEEVHTLDVSDYEGATFVHDLNSSDLPEHLKGQYRSVSMGGSAEHVFNVGNALRTAAELVEVGGTVTCSGPANNWLDHGFYQLCPTLKFDFFESNGFDLLASVACLYMPTSSSFRRFVPVYPGESLALNFVPARVSHTLIAKRLATSTTDRIPLQTIYRNKHNGERIRWRFRATAPYDVVKGKRAEAPMRRFEIDKAKVVERDGCWAVAFREEGLHPSMANRPFRSTALVYENGRPLDWIVSEPAMVGERSASFAHFGAYIYFSARDGSDPRSNNRRYEIAFPQPFEGIEPYATVEGYSRRTQRLAAAA